MSYRPSASDLGTQQRPQRTILNFEPDDDDSERSINAALLKESDHITRSEQLLDEQFDIAVKTRESLIDQRWTIKSMQQQYNNITNRFQSVNSLIKKIRLRKRRDTFIVATVFAICLFILFYNLL